MKKRSLRMVAVATLLSLMAAVPVLPGQEPHTPATPERREERTRYLTNFEIVRMVKAGVEEDAILASIHSSKCRFFLSPEELVALHKDGVSEKVLQAMIEADKGTPRVEELRQEVARGEANHKHPKPTPAQRKTILAKLKAKHSKPAPIKSAPKTEDADQRIAALKQQKQAVKSGQVLSANGGSGGQNTPHPGTSASGGGGGTLLGSGRNQTGSAPSVPHAGASGSGGGTGGGTLLSSGGTQPGSGQNTPRSGNPSAGGGTTPQNQPRGGSSSTAGTRNANSSGGQPTPRPGTSGSAGGSGGGNPNGGGTLLASNNPPGGGTPPAGTLGATGGGTGGSNPFGGSNSPGGPNPGGGSNPTGGSNPNNPAGGSTPASGSSGQPSGPRTFGTSSVNVVPTAMLSNAPVMTAAPVASNPPSQSAMLSNTRLSIDPCAVPSTTPIIKGLNSSGSNGPAVFTQDPTYNPFWVIGCHFGNSPGTAYLNSSSGQLLANLNINSWTDTLVKVSLDPSLVDAFDQENVTLVVVTPSGPSVQKGGFSFYGMRKEVYLTSISPNRAVLASITDTRGLKCDGLSDLTVSRLWIRRRRTNDRGLEHKPRSGIYRQRQRWAGRFQQRMDRGRRPKRLLPFRGRNRHLRFQPSEARLRRFQVSTPTI